VPSPPPITLIAGPTASGKSALALRLARAIGGEIVNADALQLYRDLAILSARPSLAEQEGVPHHLFGPSGITAEVGERARIVGEGGADDLADRGHVGGHHAPDARAFRTPRLAVASGASHAGRAFPQS